MRSQRTNSNKKTSVFRETVAIGGCFLFWENGCIESTVAACALVSLRGSSAFLRGGYILCPLCLWSFRTPQILPELLLTPLVLWLCKIGPGICFKWSEVLICHQVLTRFELRKPPTSVLRTTSSHSLTFGERAKIHLQVRSSENLQVMLNDTDRWFRTVSWIHVIELWFTHNLCCWHRAE